MIYFLLAILTAFNKQSATDYYLEAYLLAGNSIFNLNQRLLNFLKTEDIYLKKKNQSLNEKIDNDPFFYDRFREEIDMFFSYFLLFKIKYMKLLKIYEKSKNSIFKKELFHKKFLKHMTELEDIRKNIF